MTENVHFELGQSEKKIREESTLWMKSNINAQTGTLILTNERLVFDKDPVSGGGIIGDLIAGLFFKSLRGGVKHAIPLKQITSVTQHKFGMNIMLSVNFGIKENVKFAVGKKLDEWKEALKNAGAKIG